MHASIAVLQSHPNPGELVCARVVIARLAPTPERCPACRLTPVSGLMPHPQVSAPGRTALRAAASYGCPTLPSGAPSCTPPDPPFWPIGLPPHRSCLSPVPRLRRRPCAPLPRLSSLPPPLQRGRPARDGQGPLACNRALFSLPLRRALAHPWWPSGAQHTLSPPASDLSALRLTAPPARPALTQPPPPPLSPSSCRLGCRNAPPSSTRLPRQRGRPHRPPSSSSPAESGA